MTHPLLFHNIDLPIKIHMTLSVTTKVNSNRLHINSCLSCLKLLDHLKSITTTSTLLSVSYIILQRVRVRESLSSQ